jgi:hypothetical protein
MDDPDASPHAGAVAFVEVGAADKPGVGLKHPLTGRKGAGGCRCALQQGSEAVQGISGSSGKQARGHVAADQASTRALLAAGGAGSGPGSVASGSQAGDGASQGGSDISGSEAGGQAGMGTASDGGEEDLTADWR